MSFSITSFLLTKKDRPIPDSPYTSSIAHEVRLLPVLEIVIIIVSGVIVTHSENKYNKKIRKRLNFVTFVHNNLSFLFIFFYNKIFAVTFDEDFARATGTRADVYNYLIAIIIAVIVVLAMNLVGSLLISALVVFPAMSAMRVFKSFKKVTICSAVLSVICAFSGMVIAILAGTPVGSTIVVTDIVAFVLFSIVGKITEGRI